MKIKSLLFLFLITGVFAKTFAAEVIYQTGDTPDPNLSGLPEAIPSVYYVPVLNLDSCQDGLMPFYSANGAKQGQICYRHFFGCRLQGSCLVKTQEKTLKLTFNLERNRLEISPACPGGQGSTGACLIPFHSLAADMKHHQGGDIIFIPRVRDLQIRLPNGQYHSGYFIVHDKGTKVLGPHRFDFFTGFVPHGKTNPFTWVKLSDPNSRWPYQKITDPQLKDQVMKALRRLPRN